MAHNDIVSTFDFDNLPYEQEFDQELEATLARSRKFSFIQAELKLDAYIATLYKPKSPPPPGPKSILSLRKELLEKIYHLSSTSTLLSIRLVSKWFEKSATAWLEKLDIIPDICRKDGWRAMYDQQNDVEAEQSRP